MFETLMSKEKIDMRKIILDSIINIKYLKGNQV